jgi:hypothetical protein
MPDPELVDITPSTRILQVLGDIEFDHWQCFAELVDNGFDEFLEIKRTDVPWTEPFVVTVVTPRADDPDPTLEVRDNGRGMDLETIRNSVRAGFSGNDQFTKLGLFGMGFNIATARLGNVARVLSKRAGDSEWRGIEIDLQQITKHGEFKAPIIRESADDPSEHGTRVTVGKLKPEPRDYLTRQGNVGKLRSKLGDVYGHLLDHEGFRLYMAGQMVKPRKACVWDASRDVTRTRYGSKETISAVIPIDKPLPDTAACAICRHHQPLGAAECEVCGSTELTVQQRRIHGWLGIQRYSHTSDFGVDFLRNGRKILLRDKRVFTWQDPDDDVTEVREYPVEVPPEGRIVGEIHIDHVAVNYQKNAFEYDSRDWKTVVRTLRGDGPIQPKKRKERGYGDSNDTPLARLFDGYRRNDPGLNYLVPGNGQVALNEKAREWARAFRSGTPAYETDEIWFASAKQHDERVEQGKLAGVGATGDPGSPDVPSDVLDDMGLGSAGADAGAGADPAAANGGAAVQETEQERQERYKSAADELPELSAEYSLPSVGTLRISAYLVHGARVETPAGQLTPVYLSARRGGGLFYAFVDAQAPIFSTFGADVSDILLAEVAYHLKTRAGTDTPLTQIINDLKSRYLPDLKLDHQTLSSAARDLLIDLSDRMAEHVGPSASAVWTSLDDAERSAVETRATVAGDELAPDPGATGDFLRYLPPMLVPRVVERNPAEIINGTILGANYAALSADNEEARQVLKGRIVSYLIDLALAAEASGGRPIAELQRTRHTITLVRELITTSAHTAEV